ncbi:MAG: allantoinase AllB, partial [Chthoniobacterales bacterium]
EGASARQTIDARGLLLMPGAIDAHVHYNEPGRTEWEGWATGSLASAAGGATCVFEMPLNAFPPTLDAESFRAKRAAAEASSVLDFGLWGGITPINLDKMSELADCGVVGFKAFMSSSGTPDFERSDLKTLRAGMKQAAQLGLPVSTHAENEAMIASLVAEARAAGKTGARDYLATRPTAAEVAAIREACDIAGETGCRLHIVHVSCGEGIDVIREAKQGGVDVTAETCPHYLAFNEDDVVAIGAAAKCAPPIRAESVRTDMIARVKRGEIDTLGTDHSPCPPSMKESDDFFLIWGGIMGAQQFVGSLFAAGLDAATIARLTGPNVAKRFGLEGRKGSIAVGCDADLLLLDPKKEHRVTLDELLTRHRLSPYAGRTFPVSVHTVWVRGQTAWSADSGRGASRGRLVEGVRVL